MDYACDRLWIVDSGIINTSGMKGSLCYGRKNPLISCNSLGIATIIQRPSIIVIDLKSDAVLKRFEIPEQVTGDGLGLASIAIDVVSGDCKNTFAYLPDLVYSKIVIYSLKENKAHSMHHNYFHMNPHEGDFNVDNLKFSWDDGIFSIALSSSEKNGHRTAYFHPMIR